MFVSHGYIIFIISLLHAFKYLNMIIKFKIIKKVNIIKDDVKNKTKENNKFENSTSKIKSPNKKKINNKNIDICDEEEEMNLIFL